MNDITVTSVVPYSDELLVELTGEDEAGEIVVVSYQFEYAAEQSETVRPKQNLGERHQATIEEALDHTDYQLVE